MNNTCQVIWSSVLQQMVVVSELTSAVGKTHSSRKSTTCKAGAISLLAASIALAFTPPALAQTVATNALPTGGSVVAGQATISSNAANMLVQQSSNRAVIDWGGFNVGSNAQVNFAQPSAQSATLNRVTGPEASTILGRITAPGQVIITNGNGVFFGRDATVDVGSLVATTHSISNDNFMNSRMQFERQGAKGSVVNQGELKARLEGYVALLAPEVRNEGVIIANKGTVALAAGETIELQLSSTQQLQGVRVEASQWKALVDNRHVIEAEEGLVILSAQALRDVQSGVVRHSGSINANSLAHVGGRVMLLGDDIGLEAGSTITATGPQGGGTVLVGGDWQGGRNLPQSTRVSMANNASIDASATDNGDGGKVVLWSDVHNVQSFTSAQGRISAKAGVNGGDGGHVETSGAQLNTDGIRVNASASKGAAGLWLIDPYNYTIDSTAAGNIATTLNNGTSVEVSTAASNATYGGGVSGVGDIIVSNAISAAGAGSLTLNADSNITTNANVSVGGDLLIKAKGNVVVSKNLSTQGGEITLWSDSDNNGAGSILLGLPTNTSRGTVQSNGGNITFGGGSDPATGYAIAPLGTPVYGGVKPGAGIAIFGYTVDASSVANTGGNIMMRGDGGASTNSTRGVLIEALSGVQSYIKTNGSGTVSIYGDGSGVQGFNPWGIALTWSDISTTNGDILLDGIGNNSNIANARGLALTNFNITSTAGNVSILDRTNGAASNYTGLYFYGGDGSTLTSGSNKTISITADEVVFDISSTGSSWFKSGNVTINPYTRSSFTAPLDLQKIKTDTSASFLVGDNSYGLNAANVTVNTSTPLTVNGPITMYGGNISLNSALTASSNTITLKGAGAITQSATSSDLTSDKLLLLGGNVTLGNAGNNVGTIAASGVSNLLYLDSDTLTIGTVSNGLQGSSGMPPGTLGSATGVDATGTINIQTQIGNLTVANNVNTTDSTINAILLNAGKTKAPGTATGGNILLSGSPAITAGTGATIKIYTGEIGATGGPESLISTGQGRFRYNSDETTNFATGSWTNLGTDKYVIYRAQPTATFSMGNTMIYGEALPAFTTTGAVNGDVSNATINITSSSNSPSGNIRAGSYSFTTTSDLTGLGYNVTGSVSGSLTVAPRPIIITADSKTKVYGDNDPGLTFGMESSSTGRGIVQGDSFTGTLGRTTGENVGNYAVNLGNLANTDYTISLASNNAKLDITPRPISITANTGQSKIYGETDPILTYTTEVNTTGRGIVTGDTFTGALTRATGENVNTYAIGLGTLANSNYQITIANGNFAITPRPITITANTGQSKIFGEVDPALTYTKEANGTGRGLVGSDTFTGTLDRAVGENVNTYAIGLGTLANSNYQITIANGNFAITPRPITITANTGQSKIYGETDPALTYTTEVNTTGRGLVGNDTFTGALGRVAGENVGNYAAAQGTLTNSNYLISVTGGSFGITPRPIIITANASQTKISGDADPTLTYLLEANRAGNGRVGNDTFNGSLTRTTGETVGTSYSIGQGTLANSNYTITFIGDNFAITERPATGSSTEQVATAAVSQAAAGKLPSSFSFGGVALNPATRMSSPGIKVELVEKPQLNNAGLVTVTVPSDAANPNAGFSFALPQELVSSFASSVGVQATLPNGVPLPSWLAFDSTNGQFALTSPPKDAFPLEIALQIGGKQVVVNISERSGM